MDANEAARSMMLGAVGGLLILLGRAWLASDEETRRVRLQAVTATAVLIGVGFALFGLLGLGGCATPTIPYVVTRPLPGAETPRSALAWEDATVDVVVTARNPTAVAIQGRLECVGNAPLRIDIPARGEWRALIGVPFKYSMSYPCRLEVL